MLRNAIADLVFVYAIDILQSDAAFADIAAALACDHSEAPESG
jgi:hypothetical protein